MSQHPRDKKKATPGAAKPYASTGHGGLYDRHGPIPVPEAKESDSESAWAMFEESVMLQDNPPSVQPKFEETKTDADPETTGFEPTDFGTSGYDETTAAPLKP
jgi:hypothetical protein